MPDRYAQLKEVDGRPALRFERVLAYPPERVWQALTDTDEMFAWHPTPASFEPRVGGRVAWHPDGHVADMPENEVTDWDPPRLLGYTWAKEGERPDHLLWELRPHDDGCVLILVHTFDDRLKAARDGAGWHVCLDALTEKIAGGAPVPPGGDPDAPGPWHALNGEYQGRFGISPEEATPPPTRH